MMEEETAKIGTISKETQQEFGLALGKGNVVFALSRDLDKFARRWPQDYLRKISESRNILRYPLYGAYNEESKTLYLIKEYVKGPYFIKAGIEIDLHKQAHLVDIFALNEIKSKEIVHPGVEWKLIARKKMANSCEHTSPKARN